MPCCPPPLCCPSPTVCCSPVCCPPLVFKCPIPCRPKKSPGAVLCIGRRKRQKRYPMCKFGKPVIDKRVYRNGQFMSISYAGHIPGEMYVYGRTLPTATTFAKRRLCQYTPYEFVGVDGCCSFCTYP